MADQPQQPQQQGMIYPEIRVVEMHSRTTYALDEATNEWKIESSDVPVADKFNQWSDENDMNPFYTPTIKQSQYNETATRVVVAYSLCAAVIGRRDQALLELSLRHQMMQLTGVATQAASPSPPAEVQVDPTTLADSTPPVPVGNTASFQLPQPGGK